jgi:AraC family transcriptional regulator of adaptative response / DNA-3-methyladenine glycosylase II
MVSADPRRFRLAFQPPYDWRAAIDFLAARATPGVEIVDDTGYRRTIAAGGRAGSIAVGLGRTRPEITLDVRFPHAPSHAAIVRRVGRVFDLDADPGIVARHFGADPLLGPRLTAHAGIRMPGAWDPFELAVRAVRGQQVSVKAATTLAGRVALAFGSPFEDAGGLSRLFPDAERLVEAPVEDLGVMPARARTIRSLSQAVVEGRVTLDGSVDRAAAVAALRGVPGIGPWTASYIAMRALGDADALPTGDLVLRQAAGGCSARALETISQAWRPWRSYAVMLLWQSATRVP